MCYPNQFHYRKIVTHKDCYKRFAKALCQKHGWPEFTNSPLIWKQHDWARSKATFLGDENKFQELMNEIYGVETFVPCEEKLNLAKDEHNFFLEEKRIENTIRIIERRIICILNAGHPATQLLVAEILFSGGGIQKKHGVDITLVEDDVEFDNEMNYCVRDATYLNVDTDTGENIIRSANSLEEGLSHEADLLILMPRPTLTEKETVQSCRHIANRLNQLELSSSMKICLFPGEKSCFNLNCLAEFVHKVQAFDIVGVTEDLSLDIMAQVSASTNLPKEDMTKTAPVWGYIGVKHLVDVCSMGYTYRRDMPDGTVYTEPRNLTNYHDSLQPIWEERKSSKSNYLNQVLATADLINEWFSATPTGRVFSAAVMSDGTFDIPSGLYFSQPVRCINHEWVPDRKHPLPQEELPLDNLYSDILPTLQAFQIGRKWNSTWIPMNKTNEYDFLNQRISDTMDTVELPHKPMSNVDRFELKKYLGKRNQLYPDEYKYPKPSMDIESIFSRPISDFEVEEGGGEGEGEILWDRREPVENDPHEKLDFVLDEFLMELCTEYGVGDEEHELDEEGNEEGNEEEQEKEEQLIIL